MAANFIKQYLFSFEMFFVLFLVAGTYKGDPRLQSIPIDLTALFAVTSLYAGMMILIKRNFTMGSGAIKAFILFFMLDLYMLISLTYSSSSLYGADKLLKFTFLNGWAFFGAAVIISREVERVKRFLSILSWFGIFIAGEFLSSYGGANFDNTVLGASYLQLGRIQGMALIIMAVQFLNSGKIFVQIELLILLGILVVGAGLTGGRGPMITVLITFVALVPTFFQVRNYRIYITKYLKKVLILFLVMIGALSLFYSLGYFETAITRFNVLLTESGGGNSASTRMFFYDQALKIWADNPVFGAGIGSFPVEAGYGDERGYPHNIVLEILCELGVTGLLIYSVFLLYCLGLPRNFRLANFYTSPHKLTIFMLFLYTLANAMVSGDLNDNRLAFTVAGLMIFERNQQIS